MAGGAVEAEVTENMSVRHLPALVTSVPVVPPCIMSIKALPTVSVNVEGPVMTKVSKSSLNWQILLLQGHIFKAQLPASDPWDSK